MLRFVLFNAVFLLLPFAVYALWLMAVRGNTGNVGDWTLRTIAGLAVAGVVLMAISLLFFINFQGDPPGGKYTPAIIEDGKLDAFRAERYAGWAGEAGRAIRAPDATLASVAEMAVQSNRAPEPRSGRQEWLENLVNRF